MPLMVKTVDKEDGMSRFWQVHSISRTTQLRPLDLIKTKRTQLKTRKAHNSIKSWLNHQVKNVPTEGKNIYRIYFRVHKFSF